MRSLQRTTTNLEIVRELKQRWMRYDGSLQNAVEGKVKYITSCTVGSELRKRSWLFTYLQSSIQ